MFPHQRKFGVQRGLAQLLAALKVPFEWESSYRPLSAPLSQGIWAAAHPQVPVIVLEGLAACLYSDHAKELKRGSSWTLLFAPLSQSIWAAAHPQVPGNVQHSI